MVLVWLREQAEKGTKVVGAAGLLDGKRATTHWCYLAEMLKRSPTIRYVADAGVATTTGISASMPMMLTLIEAIAHEFGLEQWDARHASGAFRLTRPFAMTVLANRMALWNREGLGIRLEPDMDEVSLALVADAWSRTYRSNATSYAGSPDAVVTMNGVRVVPDRAGANWPEGRRVSTFPDRKPAEVLDLALGAIAARYGVGTTDVVAMQLEYRRQTARR